jgi:uncharacterized protein YbjT (DUF2867 family)
MILISGAAGKTGLAVIKSLLNRNQSVSALVRSQQQKQIVERFGVAEVLIGDLTQAGDIVDAMRGAQKVLHICPNMHPDELKIGTEMIGAASQAEVEHFVFHSVMHPQIEAMPHHWQKMRVEEILIESGLPFTIVQPASYMQNLPMSIICSEGILRVPYNLRMSHSMVDLMDVAEVYSRVLVEPGYQYAIYELAGPQAFNHLQIAERISQTFDQPIDPVQESIADWRQRVQKTGLSSYAIETLVKMFEHYDRHGFVGNPTVLRNLLQRPPTPFKSFLRKTIR